MFAERNRLSNVYRIARFVWCKIAHRTHIQGIMRTSRYIFHAANNNVRRTQPILPEWLAYIQILAKNCSFGANVELVALDKFVTGISGRSFERMCEEKPEELAIISRFQWIMQASVHGRDGQVPFARQSDENKRLLRRGLLRREWYSFARSAVAMPLLP